MLYLPPRLDLLMQPFLPVPPGLLLDFVPLMEYLARRGTFQRRDTCSWKVLINWLFVRMIDTESKLQIAAFSPYCST